MSAVCCASFARCEVKLVWIPSSPSCESILVQILPSRHNHSQNPQEIIDIHSPVCAAYVKKAIGGSRVTRCGGWGRGQPGERLGSPSPTRQNAKAANSGLAKGVQFKASSGAEGLRARRVLVELLSGRESVRMRSSSSIVPALARSHRSPAETSRHARTRRSAVQTARDSTSCPLQHNHSISPIHGRSRLPR